MFMRGEGLVRVQIEAREVGVAIMNRRMFGLRMRMTGRQDGGSYPRRRRTSSLARQRAQRDLQCQEVYHTTRRMRRSRRK